MSVYDVYLWAKRNNLTGLGCPVAHGQEPLVCDADEGRTAYRLEFDTAERLRAVQEGYFEWPTELHYFDRVDLCH